MALILVLLFLSAMVGSAAPTWSQDNRSLTPLQMEIAKQRERLTSPEVEERRDAVMRLGALRRPEASRAALPALNDPLPIVRATAAGAVLWLPGEESAPALILLLNDKNEFVRQEAAYALGRTGARAAVTPLIERLSTDKKNGVRGAAAIALGQLGDESAVVPLASVLAPEMTSGSKRKARSSRNKENVFILRAAAASLGQIGSKAGLPALIAALEDETTAADVRREAARSLGLIGDPAAESALRKALAASDAHLARTAFEALRRISNLQKGLRG
jgi:HEAT repeat protein